MTWDPFGTIGNALWISGAQWAGKSTVARILAHRHGMTAYHFDYANAHAHQDRKLAQQVRNGEEPHDFDPEQHWVRSTPEEMAAAVLTGFQTSFEWTMDDLRALVSGRPIVAEGWGLRPELVTPLLDDKRRMIVMVPTEEFRQHQLKVLPRASELKQDLSNPELGQRNRVARDRLIAEDVICEAQAHGIRVLYVDGSKNEHEVADQVQEHFAPYLAAAPVSV
jgi:2-phosphoglycerate kinase